MCALLWSAAVIVFLIGLVSNQITAQTYRWDGCLPWRSQPISANNRQS